MATITINERTLWYGWQPNLFRVAGEGPFPPKCEEGQLYLYLFVFPNTLKIGVSKNIVERTYSARRISGEKLGEIYLVLLPRAEAFRRESLITAAFSGRPAKSEWLERQHLPLVTLAMNTPEILRVLNWINGQQQDFAQYGVDGRFSKVEAWTASGQPICADEAA